MVKIPRHKSRAARVGSSCRYVSTPWRLQAPKRHRRLGSMRLSVIYVSEVNAPAGVEPIEVDAVEHVAGRRAQEQAWEKVDWYKRRWGIEDFHRTLKSGCRIEDRQLTTADRLDELSGGRSSWWRLASSR